MGGARVWFMRGLGQVEVSEVSGSWSGAGTHMDRRNPSVSAGGPPDWYAGTSSNPGKCKALSSTPGKPWRTGADVESCSTLIMYSLLERSSATSSA